MTSQRLEICEVVVRMVLRRVKAKEDGSWGTKMLREEGKFWRYKKVSNTGDKGSYTVLFSAPRGAKNLP